MAASSTSARAGYYGSAGGVHLSAPIVGMAGMPDGGGYWFTAADGGLFNYGSAPFDGSGAGQGLGTVVGMATDGVPTYQAQIDIAAIRPHLARAGSAPARQRFAQGALLLRRLTSRFPCIGKQGPAPSRHGAAPF